MTANALKIMGNLPVRPLKWRTVPIGAPANDPGLRLIDVGSRFQLEHDFAVEDIKDSPLQLMLSGLSSVPGGCRPFCVVE